ncbi:hypothetical protein CYMTET_10996 [Cymbomonas tetramitiformis]|uniref:Uncharacterized protein n=1 Tax=Cymbomonas tetramitiformis TaxID=36881 RepID=A0AAE0GNE0_9CHLO|nr:hypothetical protein CYMTET_10996 [Cymbomonas tetramitiformis]
MDNNPYFVAAERGDLLGIRALLDADRAQSVNASDVLNIRDGLMQTTALHLAVEAGHTEVVQFLLDNGANPKLCDMNGVRPLHLAAGCGYLEILEAVLKSKADPNQRESIFGDTALHWATSRGKLNTASRLLEAGVNVQQANKTSWTGLHHAAFNGHHQNTRPAGGRWQVAGGQSLLGVPGGVGGGAAKPQSLLGVPGGLGAVAGHDPAQCQEVGARGAAGRSLLEEVAGGAAGTAVPAWVQEGWGGAAGHDPCLECQEGLGAVQPSRSPCLECRGGVGAVQPGRALGVGGWGGAAEPQSHLGVTRRKSGGRCSPSRSPGCREGWEAVQPAAVSARWEGLRAVQRRVLQPGTVPAWSAREGTGAVQPGTKALLAAEPQSLLGVPGGVGGGAAEPQSLLGVPAGVGGGAAEPQPLLGVPGGVGGVASEPLFLPAVCYQVEVVEYLLKKKGNIEAVTSSGDTPIHLAARGNRLEVIEVLLMHGASKEKRNKRDLLPIETTAHEGVHHLLGGMPREAHKYWKPPLPPSSPKQPSSANGYPDKPAMSFWISGLDESLPSAPASTSSIPVPPITLANGKHEAKPPSLKSTDRNSGSQSVEQSPRARIKRKGSAGRAVAEVQKSREQNGGFYEPGPPEAVNGHTSRSASSDGDSARGKGKDRSLHQEVDTIGYGRSSSRGSSTSEWGEEGSQGATAGGVSLQDQMFEELRAERRRKELLTPNSNTRNRAQKTHSKFMSKYDLGRFNLFHPS